MVSAFAEAQDVSGTMTPTTPIPPPPQVSKSHSESSGVASAKDSAVIDWSKSSVQDTDASCGNFIFKSIKDKNGYTLYVRGKKSGTCSFSADGLTFRYPSNYGPTIQGSATIFSFARFGSDVVVAWTPGY
jgi:hypothetical protein